MKSFFSENSKQCRLGLLRVPFDENSSFMRGAADAPDLIIEEFLSDSSNFWSETGSDLSQPDIFFDAGEISQSNENTFSVIEDKVSFLLENNLRPLSLGGDHSITFPIIKAMAKSYPNLSVLQIDAHPDLYDDFQGNLFSHASPFARIMENGLAKRLVQVGIRTANAHQREQAKRFSAEMFEMKDWRDDSEIKFDSPVYLSLDIDGLDPAFAPGVSHRETGGLSTRQVINLIQRINQPVVGADIVEYNPRKDLDGITAVVCAKLMKEIAAKMLESNE